jgi:hypothetical protein
MRRPPPRLTHHSFDEKTPTHRMPFIDQAKFDDLLFSNKIFPISTHQSLNNHFKTTQSYCCI